MPAGTALETDGRGHAPIGGGVLGASTCAPQRLDDILYEFKDDSPD